MIVCLSATDEEHSGRVSIYTLDGPVSPVGQLGSNSGQMRRVHCRANEDTKLVHIIVINLNDDTHWSKSKIVDLSKYRIF